MARNNFYDKKIYEKVNKESKMILDDYKLEMKSVGKSEGTIYQYCADIKMFLCWAFENLDNKPLLKMSRRDFRRFFLILQENDLSSARINRVQCSLRNLLEFCHMDEEEYDYDRNMMRAIKGLTNETVREIHFLSDDDITYLIDYCVKNEEYQKALFVSLAYDSAARRNELLQVEKHGFLENNKTNILKGKRGKAYQALYFSRTKHIAQKYLDQRGDDNIDSLWVVNMNSERAEAKYSTLYSWILTMRRILEEKSGEYKDFDVHSLRHSSLENYENGTHYTLKELGKDSLPIKVLKVLANHESVETTESYLKNKDQELLEETFNIL